MKGALSILNEMKIELVDHTNVIAKVYTRLCDDSIGRLYHLGLNTDYIFDNEYEDDSGVYIDLNPAAMALWGMWNIHKNEFDLLINMID